MSRSDSRLPVVILVVLALVGLSACTTAETTPPLGTAIVPGSTQGQSTGATPGPGARATPGFDGTASASLPCADAQAVTGNPTPYVAELPEPPVAVGAGDEDEEELNDGVNPPLPIDPDAVLRNGSDVQQPIIPIPGAQDDPQPDDIIVYGQANQTQSSGHVAESNVAINGQSSLMTWNWGAARSFDGGATSLYMDPQDELGTPLTPDRVDGGFCCDQLAHYVPSHNIWLWAMQTQPVEPVVHAGGNRIRVKVATGDGPFDRYFDFQSTASGLPGDVWYDQAKIGTSNGYMTLSINAFRPDSGGKAFVATVVYRVALAALATGQVATPNCFSTDEFFGLVPVRNARDVMYLIAHASNTTRAVWRWPDSASTPTVHAVQERDAQGRLIGYPYPTKKDAEGIDRPDYQCPKADGVGADWCHRSDERIQSAFLANGEIGVAWNVGQSPSANADDNWPYPSLYVELIDEARLTSCLTTGCVAGHLDLGSKEAAFQFPAIVPNARGDLGMVALFGGGAFRPGCTFFIHRAGSSGWDSSIEAYVSSRDAIDPEWGHYLGIWPGPNDSSWTGGCMTIDGVDKYTTGKPHFATFGRRSDQPAQ